MIVADTSVLLPAVLSVHESHESCFEAITLTDAAVDRALTELYAALTRLPAPLRMSPDSAAAAVRGHADNVITVDSGAVGDLIDQLAASGIVGGATYDALIAGAANAHGATLLTRDTRAIPTYERLGVDVRFVAA